jgi:hypothetical protein
MEAVDQPEQAQRSEGGGAVSIRAQWKDMSPDEKQAWLLDQALSIANGKS